MHAATSRAATLAGIAAIAISTLSAASSPPRPIVARTLAQAPAEAIRPYVRPVDRWLGETRAVAVEGDRAYYSVGRSVAVADISDAGAPKLLGRSAPLELPADDAYARPIEDIAVGDGIAWTLTPDTWPIVSVWDVRDPSAVRLLATMRVGDAVTPVGLDVRGRDALLSFNGTWPERGLTALRWTAQGGIESVGRWQLDDPVVRVGAVVMRSRDEALVALGGGGIARVAVGEAADGWLGLSLIGQVTDPRFAEGARHVVVDGCRAYSSAADGTQWSDGAFWVFDVCRDGPPARLADRYFSSLEHFDPAGMAARTVGDRHFVIFADSGGGLRAIDTTNVLVDPWPDTEINPPITAEPVCHSDIAATADRLVIAGCGLRSLGLARDSMLPVTDGAILSAPSYGGQWSPSPQPLSVMAAVDDLVLIAHGNVLSIVEPSGLLAPTVTGRIGYARIGAPTFDVSDLAVAGRTAWMAPLLSEAVAIDLRDPGAPRVIGALDGSAVTLIAATERLVAASSNGQVALFDVTDPSRPRQLGLVPLDVPWDGDLAFAGDRLIVSAGTAGLLVIDVRDPSHPEVIGRNGDDSTSAMAVADGFAVALAGDNLAIFRLDAIDDGRVRLEATLPLPDGGPWPNFAAVGIGNTADRRLAVVKRGPTLVAIDITDPSQPVVGRTYRVTAKADAMAINGDRAYLFGPRVGSEFSVFELAASREIGRLALPILSNPATLGD